ncbi:hypothetical protein JCM30237_23560 [Halolamina litorea]
MLVYPGEAIGVSGEIVEIDPSGDASGAEVVASAGERRPAALGTTVRADDRLLGATAVVEVDGAFLVPLLASSLRGVANSRVAVAALVVLVALLGSGLGVYAPIGAFLGLTENGTEAAPTVPPAPPVEVAPPRPVGSLDRTETPSSTDGTPTGTVVPTPSGETQPSDGVTTTDSVETPGDATSTPRATPVQITLSFPDRTETSERTPPVPVDVSLRIDEADPAPIRTTDGTLGTVSGTVEGELTWTGSATDAVLVVQTWTRDDGWTEVRRVTVDATSPVSLADALGETVYASGSRARAFENPAAGTTRLTEGRVAVTAVLFDGADEVGRTTAERAFTAAVTNTGAGSGPLDLTLGSSGTATVVDFGGDGSLGTAADAAALPGSNGSATVSLRNDGTRSGFVRVEGIVSDSAENGQTGAESVVDATGGDPGFGAGELDGAVEVRISATFENGSTHYVVGDASGFRPLSSLEADLPVGPLDAGESLDVLVEFRLPASVGNEVQTDSVVVDFTFTLTEAPQSTD